MCRGQRGRHANQIAAFDFWGMPGLIYLTLHTAESTLIGGVVLPSAVSNLPLPLSTLISFYLFFCFLIFGAFKKYRPGRSWKLVEFCFAPPLPHICHKVFVQEGGGLVRF